MSHPEKTNLSEAVRYFTELGGFLKSKMSIIIPETEKPEKGPKRAAKIVISVENTAPDSPSEPKVVFVGVKLGITHIGGDIQTIKPQLIKQEKTCVEDQSCDLKYINVDGKSSILKYSEEHDTGEILFPGQEINYEMSVPMQFIPYIQFRVDGNLSQRHLFHNENILAMPEIYTKPIAVPALQAFNKIDVYNLIASTVKALPNFNEDTRFVDIQNFSDFLGALVKQIKTAESALNDVYKEHKIYWMQNHIKQVLIVLKQFKTEIEKLREAISSGEQEKIIVQVQIIKDSRQEFYRLNQMTEKLIDENHLSDEEVGYRYRNI